MNNLSSTFLKLICYGSMKEAEPPDCSGFQQWEELFKLSSMHNLIPVVYTALSDSNVKKDISLEAYGNFQKAAGVQCLRQAVSNKKLALLINAMNCAGVHAIVFKGCALSSLYKESAARISCDSDILISRADYCKAVKVLEGQGYTYQKSDSQEEIKAFVSKGLDVDLHLRIWGSIKSKHIAAVEPLEIDSFEKSRTFMLGDTPVRTLGYEEHFIYLIVHFAKHFVTKGMGIRHLLDITLYYNEYEENINTNRVWNTISDMGFEQLCLNVFTICCEYFKMSRSIFIEDKKIRNLVEPLLDDIIDAGAFGSAPERSTTFSVVKESYYLGLKHNRGPLLFLHMLFPHPIALPKRYLYAQKHRFLLPAAWLHRLCSFFYNRVIKNKRVNLIESIQVGNKRIQLLESLELIPQDTAD